MAGKYDSPSISCDVGGGASRGHDPSVEDWEAVAKILQYPKGTREVGLTYFVADWRRLEAFADASCAEDKKDRRSLGGIVTTFGEASLWWSSRTQACVTLSSTE